jgi:hypothetical protein
MKNYESRMNNTSTSSERATKKMIPEICFPEFVNEGEWKESALENLGKFLGGRTPERSNSDFWVGNIPWISSSDISEDDIHNISITPFLIYSFSESTAINGIMSISLTKRTGEN